MATVFLTMGLTVEEDQTLADLALALTCFSIIGSLVKTLIFCWDELFVVFCSQKTAIIWCPHPGWVVEF